MHQKRKLHTAEQSTQEAEPALSEAQTDGGMIPELMSLTKSTNRAIGLAKPTQHHREDAGSSACCCLCGYMPVSCPTEGHPRLLFWFLGPGIINETLKRLRGSRRRPYCCHTAAQCSKTRIRFACLDVHAPSYYITKLMKGWDAVNPWYPWRFGEDCSLV